MPFCGSNLIEDDDHILFSLSYKTKTLIPNITQLPVNGLINERMNSSNY